MNSEQKAIREYCQSRDAAFTALVMHDNIKAVKKHCRKYGVPMPKNDDVIRIGIYKAVQEITSIPDEVKTEAARKCLEMGFNPKMKPERDK